MKDQNLSLMEMGRMMREVFLVLKRRSEKQEDEFFKISTEQFAVLHAISMKDEEVIQKDLAEKMGKDKSAILRLIDTLEERELVRRVVDLKDRRKNYLMITKAGNNVMTQYIQMANDLMKELQEGISSEDANTFRRVLKHIKNNAEKL